VVHRRHDAIWRQTALASTATRQPPARQLDVQIDLEKRTMI
jgi:hypothetical protein